jgi:hypothetical protein
VSAWFGLTINPERLFSAVNGVDKSLSGGIDGGAPALRLLWRYLETIVELEVWQAAELATRELFEALLHGR